MSIKFVRQDIIYGFILVGCACYILLSGCEAGSHSTESPPIDTTATETDPPEEPKYINPVVTPVSADPSIIRTEGVYYLYATQNSWPDGNGPHYLPIFKSVDLVNWTHAGDVFDRIPSWGNGDFLWAPDISKRDHTYYLYYTYKKKNEPPCIGLATSKNPGSGWEDLGRAVFCAGDVNVPHSIDPFILNEGQTTTIIWGHNKVYAMDLNEDGTAPDCDKTLLAKDLKKGYEAAYVIRREGAYYLFVSGGTCCDGAESTYEVYVGRSDSLTGPYLDNQGRDLREGGGTLLLSGNNKWAGPGHSSVVVDDDGDDWLVYHAIPQDNPRLSNGINNRKGLIDRIEWQDGWPVVNGGKGPSVTPQPIPAIK